MKGEELQVRTGLTRIIKTSKLTILLLGITLLWGATQIIPSLVERDWLHSISILLAALILSLIALKLNSIGRLVQKNSSQRSSRIKNDDADQRKIDETSPPSTNLATQARLDTIGLFVPEVVNTKAKGRQAAAVSKDPHRANRLYAALFGLSNQTEDQGPQTTGRRVAVIATEHLTATLSATKRYSIQHLHPSFAQAQLQARIPSAIILEEDAFDLSPWATTLDSTGTALLLELLDVLNDAQQAGTNIYVIKSKKKHLSAISLRSKASATVPLRDTSLGSAPAARPTGHLISTLNDYAQENK